MPFSFKFLDKEDDLVKLTTVASHKMKLQPGQQAPQELFHFQIPSIKARRMPKKSRRLEESLDQEEELSPKKKKKSTSESTPTVQEKRTSVGKCDEVIKYSVPMFSSSSQCFAEFMQLYSDQT